MWSDLDVEEIIQIQNNILLGTSQEERPRALCAGTKWMLLAPHVFAWHFCSATFPLGHSRVPNLSAGEATLFSFRLCVDGCECLYVFCPLIKKSPWSSKDTRMNWWLFILAKLWCLKSCFFSKKNHLNFLIKHVVWRKLCMFTTHPRHLVSCSLKIPF